MNTSPHFALLSLPVQIRADIASRLDLPSLSALARTSRNAGHARHPLLYVRIKAQFGYEAALFIPDEAKARLDRLLADRRKLKEAKSAQVLRIKKRRPVEMRLLNLPEVLLHNIASRLNLSSYVAWMGSSGRTRALSAPLLAIAQQSGRGRAVAWPEMDEDSVSRMNSLGLERWLGTILRDTPAEQLIKAGKPKKQSQRSRLEEHLRNLPTLPALRIVARFFHTLRMAMGSAVCRQLLLDVLTQARQDAALHNDWSETVDLVTQLLAALAQSFRRLDAQGNFSVTEHTLSIYLVRNMETFLAALAGSKAEIGKPKLYGLIGELLRTHIQGYSRGWEAARVEEIWKAKPVLEQLVSNTEFENIFGLARSHAHAYLSYRDIRRAKEDQAREINGGGTDDRTICAKAEDASAKRYENCVLS